MTSTTSVKSSRIIIERISARVFCHGLGAGGGNPVTVFASDQRLSASSQERLAKECDWESVMVKTTATGNTRGNAASPDNSSDGQKEEKNSAVTEMSFFMPSGDEVSFCAHAAIGGAYSVMNNSSSSPSSAEKLITFRPTMTGIEQYVRFSDEEEGFACLDMKSKFEESTVSQKPILHQLLHDHLGITSIDLQHAKGQQDETQQQQEQLPTFVNSSVARPKTLVQVNSLSTLANAKTPKVSATAHDDDENDQGQDGQRNLPSSFARACTAVDDSTGIYLYASRQDEDGAWECRQFPRSSGYPEDPATGIAAAALAASLNRKGIIHKIYKFYQGRTMGRPSLIRVVEPTFGDDDDNNISFGLEGKVEIDHRETIEIDDTT